MLDGLVEEEVRNRFTLHLELALTLLQTQLPRRVNAGLLPTVRHFDQQAQIGLNLLQRLGSLSLNLANVQLEDAGQVRTEHRNVLQHPIRCALH